MDIAEIPQLSSILDSNACRGGFRITDGKLVSLTGDDPAVRDEACRTRDVWASLAECVPEIGTIIAKKDSGLSIVSIHGGVILETSAPVNVGILRVALRNEQPVLFEDTAKTAFAAGGTRALWKLANWIETIETGRLLRIGVGTENLSVWARKGKFGLLDGTKPSDIATSILSANQSGAPITLSYDAHDDVQPDAIHEPLALFETEAPKLDEWQFDIAGVPTTRPQHTSLKTTGRMLALHARLQSWGAGEPFEITILRDGHKPKVIAEGKEPNQIRILVDEQSGHSTKGLPSNV